LWKKNKKLLKKITYKNDQGGGGKHPSFRNEFFSGTNRLAQKIFFAHISPRKIKTKSHEISERWHKPFLRSEQIKNVWGGYHPPLVVLGLSNFGNDQK